MVIFAFSAVERSITFLISSCSQSPSSSATFWLVMPRPSSSLSAATRSPQPAFGIGEQYAVVNQFVFVDGRRLLNSNFIFHFLR